MPPEVAEDVVVDLREQAYTALQAFLPTQIAHLIMGSVAESVVRLAPWPVLTVQTSTADDKGE